MTDKKSSESRRKLLKSIAAGSGEALAGKSLPESWTKPVVDTVMLPAHAETSPVPPVPPVPPALTLTCESVSEPFGTHTPPGPTVDTARPVPLPVRIAVTPAPVAPDNVVTQEWLLNGRSLISFDETLGADGTMTLPISVWQREGIYEIRTKWQSQQCSLFWNLINPDPE